MGAVNSARGRADRSNLDIKHSSNIHANISGETTRFRFGTACVLDIKNKRNKCTQTQTLNLVCGSCDGLPVGLLLSAGMKA